ncbi:hypothetical protein OAP26_06675 [Flavobacteriaceae bacterium]|nr:hypothetical protein [Flavobacteriaceae bacterium]
MDQQNENIEFKSIDDYLEHWDDFFEKWEKDSKATFEEDVIWKNRESKGEKKLEYDVFPQPYLGNYKNHSVITLNLNPSRSKKNKENIEFEKNNLPKFKEAKKYQKYAKDFPTYDTHPFWKKQDGWIDRIFKNLGKEKPSLKDIKPFAIEICPWGSKSFQKLKINEDDSLIKYMDLHVFDVIEKVIEHSKLKIVLSVGKAYYDIFNDSSGFIKLEEISSKLFDEEFTFLEDDYKTYNDCLKKSKEYEPEEKMTAIPYNWPMKFIKRTFSIWKKGKILYINTYASGSNTPPAEHFDEIQNQLINKYLNKL